MTSDIDDRAVKLPPVFGWCSGLGVITYVDQGTVNAVLQPLQPSPALSEIDRLTAAARPAPSPTIEADLVHRRYELGRRLLESPGPRGRGPLPEQEIADPFPDVRGRPPETDLQSLDADLVLGALRHHGCLVVHDYFPRDTVEVLRTDIDLLVEGYDRWMASAQQATTPSWYEPFEAPGASLPFALRGWGGPLGTFYAGDSPRGLLHLIDAFDEAGVPSLLADVFREPSLLALEKTALRRLPHSIPTAWHQDGVRFGVDVGLLNVWVALCQTGGDTPTIGVIPARPREILPLDGEDDAPWQIHPTALAEFAGEMPLLPLELAPGDAVLFDEMLVHSTIVDDRMSQLRYGADAWFFPVSGFPTDLYVPLAYDVPELSA